MKKIGALSLIFLAILPFGFASPSLASEIDQQALQELVRAAEAAHSDALVVWEDGRQVGAWYFGKSPKKIEAMSVTKSIVNLAIGRLMTLGKIASLDEPVYKYFPEWKQGRKQQITIRHIMNHSSGIQDVPNAGLELYPSPNFLQLALAAELSDDPGTRFFYSNKAMALLAGIAEKASGKRMDLFLKDDLFAALGIKDFGWSLDQAGNPHAMAGLQIFPEDLAKLGQLMLDRGRWQGQQLIDESWFEEIDKGTPLHPRAALLWWRVPEYTRWIIDDAQIDKMKAAGVDASFIEKVESIRGQYESMGDYVRALEKALGPRFGEEIARHLGKARMGVARTEYGRMIGYEANGYLGQYIVIYPDHRTVAVRMIERTENYNSATDGFEAFHGLVRNLVK